MRNWVRSLRTRSISTPKVRRPNLECLEDRFAPAVFNVNSLSDTLTPAAGVVTLRSAIEAANATPGSNTINLTVAGTYKITIPPAQPDDTSATENNATGDFDIIPNAASATGSTLTIHNTSGGKVTVDGNHLDRVFDINPNDVTAPSKFTVVLKGLTIQNGIAQPGDAATGSGGGIRDQGNVSLTLTNVTVTHNIATADGGGISMENGASTPWTLTLNDSTITNNHAGDAGGGVETDGSGRTFINPGTVISGNTSVNQGAGIWLDAIMVDTTFQSSSLTVNGAFISNNKALSGAMGVGGGIGNAGNGAVTIVNSTLADNFAGLTGGGFGDQNAQGSLTVRNSVFLNNTATGNGGGIAAGGPVTSITSSEIDGNTSGGTGGGLFANGVQLLVQGSTFANNLASGNGGGIELETTGAGLFHGSTITNSTLTGNFALNNGGTTGGGIDAGTAFTGDVLLLNDTINANFASDGGGAFQGGTGNFGLQNTIVAGNLAAVGTDADSATAAFIDLGGNLIGVGGPGFTAATSQTGTADTPLDPLLGALHDNGGPVIGAPGHTMTLETELLLKGSPAIGKGVVPGSPGTDERGFPSVVNGGVNVGATSSASKPSFHGHLWMHHTGHHGTETVVESSHDVGDES
jgi:predicted outer membrane repeat protein